MTSNRPLVNKIVKTIKFIQDQHRTYPELKELEQYVIDLQSYDVVSLPGTSSNILEMTFNSMQSMKARTKQAISNYIKAKRRILKQPKPKPIRVALGQIIPETNPYPDPDLYKHSFENYVQELQSHDVPYYEILPEATPALLLDNPPTPGPWDPTNHPATEEDWDMINHNSTEPIINIANVSVSSNSGGTA